jgi:hypothetical protein
MLLKFRLTRFVIAYLLTLPILGYASQAVAVAPACNIPQMQQFAFYLGDWELKGRLLIGPGQWQGITGKDQVRSILDGCAIEQNVEYSGLKALSLTTFRTSLGKWQQVWNDNSRPEQITLTGGRDGERMVLFTSDTYSVTKGIGRQTYRNIRPDSFDVVYEESGDQGKTWQVLFESAYTRKKP